MRRNLSEFVFWKAPPPVYRLNEHVKTPRRAWHENPLHRLCYQISSLQYDECLDLHHCRVAAHVSHTRGRVIIAYYVSSPGVSKRFTDARKAAEYVMELAP